MNLSGVSAACAVCVIGAPALAAGPSWSYFNGGDAAFLALAAGGTLERAVAEGRVGNRQNNGDWEQGIWEFGGMGTPEVTGQHTITSGTSVSWSVQWNGTDTVSYTFGGQSVSWNAVSGTFTDIFIRTRADDNARTDLTLMGFDFNNDTVIDFGIGDLFSENSNDVDYIRVQNKGIAWPAFTLYGVHTFTWDVPVPNGSQIAYQVKLTNIPAPGAMALLGLGGLLAGRRRRV